MRPSQQLNHKREAVRVVVRESQLSNPRIFGSVLHGTDHENSDLDLLVDALPGTTLFELGRVQEALEDLLGVRVDLCTPEDLPADIRHKIMAETKPL